jgi:HSP20 family protein
MSWNAFGNGTSWDPWRELAELYTHFDTFFWDGPRASAGDGPPVELWSREDGLRLLAQVPGVAPDALELSVVGDTLTLKGSRERDARTFQRSIRLPFAVDGEAAKARVENGMLDVELPRSAATKPRRIAIQER